MTRRAFGGNPRHRRKWVRASLAVLALVAAGCGGNGSVGGSAGASDADVAAGVKAAEEATAKNLEEPTTIPLSEPLKEKPPTGETLVFMKCLDDPFCQVQADAVEEAAEALGWTFKAMAFKFSDPATMADGMKRALEFDPVAVALSGMPREVWETVVPEYKAAGVYIVPAFAGPMEYDDVVIGQAGGSQANWGEMVANWTIADSGGEAHVVVQTTPSYAVLGTNVDGYTGAIEENCPKCTVTMVENTIPQVSAGQTVGSVVAAVQKDPKINYVYTAGSASTIGIVSALDATGLGDRVKLTSGGGNETIQSNVKSGKEAVTTGAATEYAMWLLVDMVLRKMQGVDFDSDGADRELPTQLLTTDTDFDIETTYDKPADWRDQLKKLWQVGS